VSPRQPIIEGTEEYGVDHSGEGRLWAELHNLRRAVEAFPKLLADELARMRDAREDKDNAVDERLRAVELEQAKAPTNARVEAVEKTVDAHGQELAKIGVRVAMWGALAGILAGGIAAGIAEAIARH